MTRRRLPEVTIATWNIGPGDRDDLARLMRAADVIGLQEAGDREPLLKHATDEGWTLIAGKGKRGQSSAPILVAPHVKVLRRFAWPLLVNNNELKLGVGAGPSQVKPKWALGARLNKDGVKFGVSNKHAVASQQHHVRESAARRANERLVRRLRYRRIPWFITADENEDRNDKHNSLQPIYDAGFANSHQGRELPTHDRRAIDYVWWKRNRARLVAATTINTRSDHRALVCTFLLLPRKFRHKEK